MGRRPLRQFPISARSIDEKYSRDNGDCAEPDNFYPWMTVDDDNTVIGHFIMRYTGGDPKQLRFGWVVVDDSVRGKGYGTELRGVHVYFSAQTAGC